jgi:hypothetical protein
VVRVVASPTGSALAGLRLGVRDVGRVTYVSGARPGRADALVATDHVASGAMGAGRLRTQAGFRPAAGAR